MSSIKQDKVSAHPRTGVIHPETCQRTQKSWESAKYLYFLKQRTRTIKLSTHIDLDR